MSSPTVSRASELTAFKRRRATIKVACTRMDTFVTGVNIVTPDIAAQLEERRARLDMYYKEYDDVQTQVESIDELEMDDRRIFEEAFYSICAKIRQLLRPIDIPVSSARSSPVPSSAEDAGSLSHVRLPKLNLPSFSGSYDEWFPFYDTFMSVIHGNRSLGNIQRFQYLRASLSGEAINIIKSLEVSERNYELAWRLLKDRYDNKRAIVQTHIKAILELPVMTKENAGDLRRISDGASAHVRALIAIQRPADTWDDLLVHLLNAKLDAVTSREWQASLQDSELPTLKQFTEFLARRSQILEASSIVRKDSTALGRPATRSQAGAKHQALHATATRGRCTFCAGDHFIHTCNDFLALSISQRIAEMRKRKICLNCLRTAGHRASKCLSGTCKICSSKHNTLLHITQDAGENREGKTDDNSSASIEGSSGRTIVTYSSCRKGDGEILLSTAVVDVYDVSGARVACRILLDSGSQANFISGNCLRALRLKTRPINISVSGIGKAESTMTQMARLRIGSRVNAFTTEIECMVTDRITGRIPSVTIGRRAFRLPSGIELADPQFNVAADIDVLVGADLFWQLLCVGQIKATCDHPTIQKTRLGWVLAGRMRDMSSTPVKLRALHVSIGGSDLQERVNRFWQIEEMPSETNYTIEEQACEAHFMRHVTTDARGRYVVKLPLREDAYSRMGESRDIALKRFSSLERRFGRDPKLKLLYGEFLREYVALGHMREVNVRDNEEGLSVYLPHHGVFKDTSQGSKLRVVFDASCKTSTGVSLNDALLTGPTIQEDLIAILMRFRTFAYVFSADIIKMYRQILVHESQTRLQRILWRESANLPVKTYELLTVTYGTTSASYLATRCLQHLAQRYATEYPGGSGCILRDFYVDDLLTGANTISDARRVRDETIELLKRGQFELSKWSSNCKELLPAGADARRDLWAKRPEPRCWGSYGIPSSTDFDSNMIAALRRITRQSG